MGSFGLLRGHPKSVSVAPFNTVQYSNNTEFLLAFHMSLSCTISAIVRYWSKITDFNPPYLQLAPLLAVTHGIFAKVYGIDCVILHLAILIQYRLVTDGMTDEDNDRCQ